MRQQEGNAKPRILVAEDDEHIGYLLSYLLQREGFEVLAAADGRAAAEMIDRIEPPQLALLDLMLPFLDGFQVLERIRARPAWKHVPVVILTAKSNEQNIVRALDDGACDYVVKPFQPNELMARLKRLLRRTDG